MKISIIYVSVTGNTEQVAGYIEAGIRSVGDIDVKLMNLEQEDSFDVDFVNDSSAVIFGTPTYIANMAWQMKKWFDTYRECKLAGKIGAGFATANFITGGGDVAILGLINHMLVKGMLVYSSGSGLGQPFIHLGPIAIRGELEEKRDMFEIFGKRIAEKCLELFPGK